MKTFLTVLFLALFSHTPTWALDEMLCQCRAKGPGFEETNKVSGGIDKICSYSCRCVAWDKVIDKKTKTVGHKNFTTDLSIDVMNTQTSASSKESWDFGSHVCHGQYSYRSNLGDPNWKITVKFDSFSINTQGEIAYPENRSRTIALGVAESGFNFTKAAPEISASLKAQLKKF